MPEALVVLAVFVVAVVAWMGAWMHARDPAQQNPREDFAQAQQHAMWLEQRLEVARRERWEHHMVVSLTNELELTQARARTLRTVLPAA